MSEAEAAPAVYVVGYEAGATEDDFKTAFGSFGEVKDVALRGKDKPFAFVTFDTAAACEKAVAGGVKIGGADVTVEVQTSKPRGKKPRRARGGDEAPAGPNTSIYIKGIPAESENDAVTEKVTSIFQEFGTVTAVVYKGKDFAFVEFEDEESMEKASKASAKYDDADLVIEARETKGTGGKKKKNTKKKKKRPVQEGPNTTIYVKLEEGAPTADIRAAFGEHGEIKRITNRSNIGFAFIQYGTPEEMQAALAATTSVAGKECAVDEQKPRAEKPDADAE